MRCETNSRIGGFRDPRHRPRRRNRQPNNRPVNAARRWRLGLAKTLETFFRRGISAVMSCQPCRPLRTPDSGVPPTVTTVRRRTSNCRFGPAFATADESVESQGLTGDRPPQLSPALMRASPSCSPSAAVTASAMCRVMVRHCGGKSPVRPPGGGPWDPYGTVDICWGTWRSSRRGISSAGPRSQCTCLSFCHFRRWGLQQQRPPIRPGRRHPRSGRCRLQSARRLSLPFKRVQGFSSEILLRAGWKIHVRPATSARSPRR